MGDTARAARARVDRARVERAQAARAIAARLALTLGLLIMVIGAGLPFGAGLARGAAARAFESESVPPRAPTRPAPRLIELRDALCMMRSVDRLRKALENAVAAGAPSATVVISTSGRWRPDVVLGLIQAVRASPLPITVEANRATAAALDAGTLLLALGAPSRTLHAESRVHARAEDVARELAPSDAKESQILRDLHQLLTTPSAPGAAAPPRELIDALARPEQNCWLVVAPAAGGGDGRPRARIIDRAPELHDPSLHVGALVHDQRGTPELRLDAAALRALGWSGTSGAAPVEGPEAERGRAQPPVRVVIAGDLAGAIREARETFAVLERTLEEVEKLLDLPAPEKRAVSRGTYRRHGVEAGGKLDSARAALSALLALLGEAPEVTRDAVPREGVGLKETPGARESRWRTAVRSASEKLEELDAQAARFRDLR